MKYVLRTVMGEGDHVVGGFHTTPSARFVAEISKFQCEILFRTICRAITIDSKTVALPPENQESQYGNAKSILTLMSASITSGAEVEFVFDGSDAEDAVTMVENLFETDAYFSGTTFERIECP